MLLIIFMFSIFHRCVHGFVCYHPGNCVVPDGPFKIITTSNVEECIGECSIRRKCDWTTFNPKNFHCSFYESENCEYFDSENCPMCLTSERQCIMSKFHITFSTLKWMWKYYKQCLIFIKINRYNIWKWEPKKR